MPRTNIDLSRPCYAEDRLLDDVFRWSSRSECKIIKRSLNQLELAFFDDLVRLQLDGKAIGRVNTWSTMNDDENQVECKIVYSNEGELTEDLRGRFTSFFSSMESSENLNQSQQLAYELLKNEINLVWDRPLTTTIAVPSLIDFIRKFIEYSLIANNLARTLVVCLETLPCKLIDHK